MSINRVIISGNLTRDAECKRTASGLAIVSFGLAVNDRRKNNATGEWEDYPNFVDVSWFGTYAEKYAGSMAKGTKAVVEGKLRQSRWTNNEGQTRSKLEVIADVVELPPRQQGQFNPPQQHPQQAQASMYDNDIPF